MSIPLEDQFGDVVGKARRGLRLTESQLAQQAGVDPDRVEAFLAGRLPEGDPAWDALPAALGLNAPALRDLALGRWHPGEVTLPATLAAFNVPFGGDMTVNFYLAWDGAGRAAAFDTGTDCSALLETLRERKLKLDAIFLTHTHDDHIAELDRLEAETDAPIYVSEFEKADGATAIKDGETFTVGGLTVTARLTAGHSPGGTTYVISGLDPMIAVVGDALFAASMGGVGPDKFAAALQANREKILALPESTLVLPGHGPVTTVGNERRHNPFYAGAA